MITIDEGEQAQLTERALERANDTVMRLRLLVRKLAQAAEHAASDARMGRTWQCRCSICSYAREHSAALAQASQPPAGE